MFGAPSARQQQRFFFFKRFGTEDEYPLTDEELGVLADIFDGNMRILDGGFAFFQLLSKHAWNNEFFNKIMRSLDNGVSRAFPPIRKFSFWQTIWLQKPSS